jgi:hypothetical protein
MVPGRGPTGDVDQSVTMIGLRMAGAASRDVEPVDPASHRLFLRAIVVKTSPNQVRVRTDLGRWFGTWPQRHGNGFCQTRTGRNPPTGPADDHIGPLGQMVRSMPPSTGTMAPVR